MGDSMLGDGAGNRPQWLPHICKVLIEEGQVLLQLIHTVLCAILGVEDGVTQLLDLTHTHQHL